VNTYSLKTFGCKLNQYESQLIRENFIKNDWSEAPSIQMAEYLVINSCAVTSSGIKELRKFVRSSRDKNPKLKIIVTGCVVEIYPDEVKDLPLFNMVSNKNKYRIPGIIFNQNNVCLDKISSFNGHTRAFVKIQDGCNNKCSYCCAWMARGPSRSRRPEDVLEEITILLERGYKEIVLTGLCLGDFGKDIKCSLAELLQEIESLDFNFRLRLSSIEPQDVNNNLISCVEKLKKIVPHLHIPLQSGSDKILSLMGRKYSRDYFQNTIYRLKDISNFQFSTDVIVGFPKENDDDFQNTLNLLKELLPVRVHIFPFSPRPNTKAYGINRRIPSDIINRRKQEVRKAIKQAIIQNFKNQIGKRFTVLCEQKRGNLWSGYTENYIKVDFEDNRDLKNQFVVVEIYKLDETKPALLAKAH